VLGANSRGGIGVLNGLRKLVAKNVQRGREGEHEGVNEGIRQSLGIDQSLADQYARLVRIAEAPQCPRAVGSADHARILAVDEKLGARLVDIPEIDGQTKAVPTGLEFAAQ